MYTPAVLLLALGATSLARPHIALAYRQISTAVMCGTAYHDDHPGGASKSLKPNALCQSTNGVVFYAKHDKVNNAGCNLCSFYTNDECTGEALATISKTEDEATIEMLGDGANYYSCHSE